jgi:hypothetical protein
MKIESLVRVNIELLKEANRPVTKDEASNPFGYIIRINYIPDSGKMSYQVLLTGSGKKHWYERKHLELMS